MKKFAVITGFLVLFLLVNVSAYIRICLSDCQGTPVDTPRYVCQLGSSSRCNDPGYCDVCVTDSGYPTDPNRCASQTCTSSSSNNTIIDSTPPILTINSPQNNFVYNSRKVLFDISVNENSEIFFYDNVYGNKWIRICADCTSSATQRSLKEGFNNITIKAVDDFGNSAKKTFAFIIDSSKPRITKTEPRKGFANGDFEVKFKEENPVSLYLIYGNNLDGYKNSAVNIATDCVEEKGAYACIKNIPLFLYDGQDIEYWFNLTDIAGSYAESTHALLQVDITPPLINRLDYNVSGKKVLFNISVTEQNFDLIEYYDNSESKPRLKVLCSSLKNGECVKKKSFSSGYHALDIQVLDKAGNAVSSRIEFDIS